MKPKKLGILLIALFFTAGAFAQCWVTPQYQDSVQVTNGSPRNENFSGSVYFYGAGNLSNSNNFNNWTALGFDGSIKSEQNINYNSSAQKVYTNGSVEIQKVSMSGGDTIFANGSLVLDAINSNNSTQGNYNVIMLSASSSLAINGTQYKIGDTLKLSGNSSNYVYIVGCVTTVSTLPITLQSFSFNENTLSWSFTNNNNIKSITIQGSNDGSTWSDIQQLSSTATSFSIGETAKKAGLIFLAPLILLVLIGRIRSNITKVFSFLFISTLFFLSCSKSEAVTSADKTTSYEMYRLKITDIDGNTTYSNVVLK